MANNKVRVDFMVVAVSGFQKMNSGFDRLNTLERDIIRFGKNTVRNTTDRSVGEFHSVVEINTDYAEPLIKMGRKIFPNESKAQENFMREINQKIQSLI
jgi:hypothetical protein